MNPVLISEDILGLTIKVNNISIGIVSFCVDKHKNIEYDNNFIREFMKEE